MFTFSLQCAIPLHMNMTVNTAKGMLEFLFIFFTFLKHSSVMINGYKRKFAFLVCKSKKHQDFHSKQ